MAIEQNRKKSNHPKPMSIRALVFWTGLFGGVFWSGLGFLAYAFNFTDITPNIILESWVLGDWKYGWLGIVISLILFGIISIGVAYIYYGALKRLNGIWPGMIYGIALYFIVFIVLNPLFPGMGPINEFSRDTIITSICLYTIYGLFIGYSISYEYNNQRLTKE